MKERKLLVDIDYKSLAKCLEELLVDTFNFELNQNSPVLYKNCLSVKITKWKHHYYGGNRCKGLLQFTIDNKEFVCLLEYDSWGEIEGSILEESLLSAKLIEDFDFEKAKEVLIKWEEEEEQEMLLWGYGPWFYEI